jgi:hypothetical protein
MLETLQKYKQDIATASHKCENMGPTDGVVGDTTMKPLADDVGKTLGDTIERVNSMLSHLRENQVQWESVDKARNELAAWLNAKKTEVTQLESRPAKLHLEAASLELAHLEVLLHRNVEKLIFSSAFSGDG